MLFKLLLLINLINAPLFAQQQAIDTGPSEDEDHVLSNQIGNNISMAITQLTKELEVKVKDEKLVETLRAEKGKLRNLHKLNSDSSAYKWIQQNRFLMNRLSFLVANITEEFVIHEVIANNNKIDHRTADSLINRISQHLAANQRKILPSGDRRLQKIEVGSGFAEGITAIALGKIIGFKVKSLLDHFLKKEKCKTKVKVIVVTQPTTTTIATTIAPTIAPPPIPIPTTEEPDEPDVPDYTPPVDNEPPIDMPDYPQDYPPIPPPMVPDYYYYYSDYPYYYDYPLPVPNNYYYYIDYPTYYYYYDYYPYYYYYYLPPFYDYYGIPPYYPPPTIPQPPIVTQPVSQCCNQQPCCVQQQCCGGGGVISNNNQQQQQQQNVPFIPFPEPIIIEQERLVPVPEPFPVYIPEPMPPIYYPVPFPCGRGKKKCRNHHYNSGSGHNSGRSTMIEDDDEDTPNAIYPPVIDPIKDGKSVSGFEFSDTNFNLPPPPPPPHMSPSNMDGPQSLLPPPMIGNLPPIGHMSHLPTNGFSFHSNMPTRNLVKRDIDDTFINRNDSDYESHYEYAQQRRRRRRRRRGGRGRRGGGRGRGGRRGGGRRRG